MDLSKKTGLLITAIAAAVAGCSSSTPSNLVKTEAIWAEMKIEADGKDAKVGVELNISGRFGNNVILVGEDRLEVSAAGQTKKLTKDTDFLDVDYETSLNVSQSNTLFTISLYRDDNEVRRSSVELPMEFDLLSPRAIDRLRADSTFNVQIDGSDSASQTSVHMYANCKNITGGTVSNHMEETFNNITSRSYTVNQLPIFNDSLIDKRQKCTMDIKVIRTRNGSVASGFAGGSSLKASQHRTVKDIEVRLD